MGFLQTRVIDIRDVPRLVSAIEWILPPERRSRRVKHVYLGPANASSSAMLTYLFRSLQVESKLVDGPSPDPVHASGQHDIQRSFPAQCD